MLSGCHKCNILTALLVLIAGVLFLLVDIGVWTFWNLSWWTVLLVIVGVTCMGKSCCKECCAVMEMKSKKK